MQDETMTREQVGAAIARKAWADEAFRKAVLADPNAVFEREVGQPPPDGLRIKVLEDTANTVHFVIPAKPENAGELSDAELEGVAGGVSLSISYLSANRASVSLSISVSHMPKPRW